MGPGVRKDERIYGASLLDVAPTVLTCFGLPCGAEMDGKVLVDAFERPPDVWTVASWDALDGPSGLHEPDKRIDPVEAQEAINQLVALGYIAPPDEDRRKAVDETVRELDYNLARSYMDAGRHLDAEPLLARLWATWDSEFRFGLQLVTCLKALDRTAEARALLEEVFQRKDVAVSESRKKLAEWAKEREGAKPEELTEQQKVQLRKLRARASWNPYAMEFLMGSLLLQEGDASGALAHFRKAEEADAGQPALYLQTAEAHLSLRQGKEAERSLEKALDLDPDSAEAMRGLCRVYLRRGRNREAAEAAAGSIRLLFFNPRGFVLLGTALTRLGDIDDAAQALRMAVTQAPDFPEAHLRLAYVYKRRLFDHLKAAEHMSLARKARRKLRDLKMGRLKPPGHANIRGGEPVAMTSGPAEDPRVDNAEIDPAFTGQKAVENEIVVVTGLPRSGTSLMMQMLAAGGVPVLVDDVRPADEDNPRGYYEYEKTRRLRNDASWLTEAQGKAIKIIVQLLAYLPAAYSFRIIFMERDLDEVLGSQRAMLDRSGKAGTRLDDAALQRTYRLQVARARQNLRSASIPVLNVAYEDAVSRPRETAARVNSFLGGSYAEEAMAAAVSPSLYRQKR